VLLDTNVFIWASREPGHLSPEAKLAITDPFNERFVSMASVWEMQIQHGLGKLPLAANVVELSQKWLSPLNARILPVELQHLDRLYSLPAIHRDPFDKIMIAQALVEGMKIVSSDSGFHGYAAQIVW